MFVKKIISLLVIFAMFCLSVSTITTASNDVKANEVKVKINGVEQKYDQPAIIIKDSTMVPLRGIFEALGATVEWNEKKQKVTAKKDDINVELIIGSNKAKVNNVEKKIDSPPVIINERTLVPARFVSEALGAIVEWDEARYTVNIYTIKRELLDALRNLDARFDKSVMDWCISLYDPEEGGYYYAVSARDNEGFAPDIESTAQMIANMQYMGIITPGNPSDDIMPPEIKEKLVNFMKVRQDPETGYFYDKQFGSQVSDSKKVRNLGQAVNVLSRFGEKPLYLTPTERVKNKDDNQNENTEDVLPAYLQSEEAFLEWLDERPWDTNVYGAGANLSGIASLIKAAGLWETAVEYVMDMQNPETGLWGEGLAYINVNAAMKLRGFFANSEPPIPMPYIDKLIESVIYVIKNETPSTAAEVWNPIILLRDAIKSYSGKFPPELKEKIDESMIEIVNAVAESMDYFRQPDNGYSWSKKGSSAKSQGVYVSLGEPEGDVNATNLLMMARRDCYLLVGVEAPPLWDLDRDYFWEKTLNAEPIIKN